MASPNPGSVPPHSAVAGRRGRFGRTSRHVPLRSASHGATASKVRRRYVPAAIPAEGRRQSGQVRAGYLRNEDAFRVAARQGLPPPFCSRSAEAAEPTPAGVVLPEDSPFLRARLVPFPPRAALSCLRHCACPSFRPHPGLRNRARCEIFESPSPAAGLRNSANSASCRGKGCNTLAEHRVSLVKRTPSLSLMRDASRKLSSEKSGRNAARAGAELNFNYFRRGGRAAGDLLFGRVLFFGRNFGVNALEICDNVCGNSL